MDIATHERWTYKDTDKSEQLATIRNRLDGILFPPSVAFATWCRSKKSLPGSHVTKKISGISVCSNCFLTKPVFLCFGSFQLYNSRDATLQCVV